MTPPENGPITVFTEDAAWAELASHDLGRLAISLGGEPEIFPVNFVVDGRGLLFRTAEGSKLLAATLGGVAALEVDRWDSRAGVSVIARGPLRALEDADEIARADAMPLRSWVGTVKTHYVRLEVATLSGRGFTFGDAPEEYQPVG